MSEGGLIPFYPALLKESLLPRKALSDKSDYGHVLTVCGSRGMAGAAFLCATGALYSGAGLVTAALPDTIELSLAARFTEIMTLPLKASPFGGFSSDCAQAILQRAVRARAVVIGCGLSVNDDTRSLVADLLKHITVPVVLDADGLNILSENIHLLESRGCRRLVMTPHEGEMARLIGETKEQIAFDRFASATAFSRKFGVTLVLKGHQTITACPNGRAYLNTTGNPGMAKGGSGDALAGIIAGFIAQGIAPEDAAVAAVYLHGRAGDTAARNISQRGMTATDLLQELRLILKDYD